jgi:nucleoside-diphosphate-sugar epimerase
MAQVLISGTNGFVYRTLFDHLENAGYQVTRRVRQPDMPNTIQVGDIGLKTDWQAALAGCDLVVHLAARVHILHDVDDNPIEFFRTVNTKGTLNLAHQAARAGVCRFVYLSSVKVNGELGRFSEVSPSSPQDLFAMFKWEAEQGLLKISADTGMEVVILRPPLVYGPGGWEFHSANAGHRSSSTHAMGLAKNRRSLLYLGNLVGAIASCLSNPRANGKTFLVSDEEVVSTPELIREAGMALGRSSRLLPFPHILLRFGACLLGKSQNIERLLGSLELDSSLIRKELDWSPTTSLQEGLQITADWYRLTWAEKLPQS